MAVSDSSKYWIIEQMIWNALEDTSGLPAAANLATWRGQQNPRGNEGKNYKTGIIPNRDAIDTPALYFRQGEIATPDELVTIGSLTRYYTIEIVGELRRESAREAEVDKLVKRFQELVETTLGAAITGLTASNSSYHPDGDGGTHILEEIFPGSPIFPDWTEPGTLPLFQFPIFCRLIHADLWLI